MAYRSVRRFCCDCNEPVLAEKYRPNHILHLLLTVLTAGFWLIPWALMSTPSTPHCTRCGSSNTTTRIPSRNADGMLSQNRSGMRLGGLIAIAAVAMVVLTSKPHNGADAPTSPLTGSFVATPEPRQVPERALPAQETASQRVVPPGAPQSTPQSATFRNGRDDRIDFEAWFENTSGDFRKGALIWASERSKSNPKPCGILSTVTEVAGCNAAQVQLSVSDTRRKSETEYRLGWNSYTASNIVNTNAANSAKNLGPVIAVRPQSTSTQATMPATTPKSVSPTNSATTVYGPADIAYLRRSNNENSEAYFNKFAGKALFRAIGQFGYFEKMPPSPDGKDRWMASVLAEKPDQEQISCIIDYFDIEISNLRSNQSIIISGLVGLPLESGLMLAKNCRVVLR